MEKVVLVNMEYSNLYNGDTIYVEGYDSVFKVTMYENDKPRYIPFI